MSGEMLGRYRILDKLAEGGMGEVYRARDTRLDRTVAIKVLPLSIAADPQRRERFEREARALSSLNHPHICALYDVGEGLHPEASPSQADTIRFLVLEYLEGRTLADRLTEGALPPAEALRHGIAICEALDAAHRSGVVHRDLKPANVMLTRAGAKLLDFGLAKGVQPLHTTTPTVSMVPAASRHLTVEGAMLGTLQYMAPEQIEGLEADARTDIFAFGGLLFEMFTGRPAFPGKTRGGLLRAILNDDPPSVSHVQATVPAAMDRIISTCLAKDPDERYQSARDLRRDLAWVADDLPDGRAARTVALPARATGTAWLVAALSIATVIVTAVFAARRVSNDPTPSTGAAQFTIAPPENTSFGGPAAGGTGYAAQVAISPDGRNVVFVAGTPSAYRIWLRPVATLLPRPLAGTEGGSFPFWSPDSQFVAFFAGGKVKKVAIAGGSPMVLCDAPFGRGGSWSRNDVILMSASVGSGLVRVSGAGGATTAVTTLDAAAGEAHRWPHFLPDGHHFFYTASTGPCCPPLKPSTIRIGSLDPSEPAVTLLQTESAVAYGAGHIVFARDQTLVAQRFDADARTLQGDAFPVAEHVATEQSRYLSASLSENGTLVYAPDNVQAARRLTWFDRAGHALGRLGDPASYVSLALSPDERRVAVALRTSGTENLDIWTIDTARGTRSRLTRDPDAEQSPLWSPDGRRVVFQRGRLGTLSLHEQSIDETTAHDVVLESHSRAAGLAPSSWSADGRFIAYTLTTAFPLRSDLWVLPLFGDRKPFPLTQTADFLESSPTFSPDGRWIAYTTDEGGGPNISVQPFLRPGRRYPISSDGGSQPVWRADGKELFYLRGDGMMMSVSTQTAGEFAVGTPQALFPTGLMLPGLPLFNRGHVYAATKDGRRFLVSARTPEAVPLTVIVNWIASIH